jgi:ABC-type multidrug transport system ATPase subunit
MIRAVGLVKSYGSHPALRGVNLEVAAGEVLALVGPNGAGKSTILRILAGVIRPDEGVATIAGRSATDWRARKGLGYLPQKPGVAAATSIQSLAHLVATMRGLPEEAGTRLLQDPGLGLRLNGTIGELSGGQRQRLMLALATLGPIDALLLDEPGISLDADGAEDVHARIRKARAAGTAVLFASHHLSDVALLADRVAVLVNGVVKAHGTMAELARRAAIPWNGGHPPLEAIYRSLVARSRGWVPEVACAS